MKQSFKRLLLLFVAVAFVGVNASAQVTTSSLSGKVADEAGEPLAGAAIVAVHTPSGTQYAAVANNEGRFVINGMRAGGPYKVEISFLGMGTLQYNDVALKLGDPYEIDAVLKNSTELEAVIFTAESSFNASKTGAGSNFGQSAVENMPTINRSVYDIVKFTPQATVNKGGGISFAGANNRYNSFQIDGAIANDSFGLAGSGTNGGQTGANPIALDAIEEIQVVVAPFDVRQSGFTGGSINAITKSGTNTVKGSFYTYFNNEDFIGTTAGEMEKADRKKYDDETSQTYGFTIGAPIIKNKLFLFASAEYYKKSYPNVYSPLNGTYDNIELKNEVILPDGTNLGKFFNSDMAQAVIDHYNKTYGADNAGETFTQHQVSDQAINVLARIDWNINDRNKLTLRYQYMDAYADKYGSSATSYTYNNSAYKQANKTNTAVIELQSRVSDKVSNEFRATGVFVRDRRTPGTLNSATMYIQDNVTVNLGTEYSSAVNRMYSDTYTLEDNVSIFLGNHNITAGTHNEFFKFNNAFIQYAFGEYTFSSLNDFFNNTNFKYDYIYSDPEITGATTWSATTYAAQFGLYAQDEWKPNTSFTLTYGLRLDMPLLLNKPGSLAMSKGYESAFNETEISKNTGERVGTVPKASVLFSPRVGFRWYIDKAKTSLLRGGAGLFTGRVPFVWLSNAYNNTGLEMKSVTLQAKDVPADFPMTSNPYQDVIQSGIAAASGSGATINTLNRNFKYPQVFRVNVGYEQSFGHGWKFIFDALYSKTLNNVFFKNLAIGSDNVVYAVNANAAEANPGSTAPYYSTLAKGYSAIVALQNTNKGYTYSLSGQLQKHFDFGLDLMASYTFGHSYSVNDGTSSVAYSNWKYNYSVDTNSPELSHSLFDKPHKVMAVVSYTTPMYLRGLQTTISLSYQGESGQRYSYTMNESVDFNGDGYKNNSLMYVPTMDEIGQMSWASSSDALKFENFIRSDRYLSSHRGQWSEKYAGIAPFEHHFDLHIAQDFYYDKEHGRKLQFTVDFLNISNLFNRTWGLYYSSAYNRQILNVTDVTKDAAGNATPTYKFSPKDIYVADFYSRWRCQLGFRFTF